MNSHDTYRNLHAFSIVKKSKKNLDGTGPDVSPAPPNTGKHPFQKLTVAKIGMNLRDCSRNLRDIISLAKTVFGYLRVSQARPIQKS